MPNDLQAIGVCCCCGWEMCSKHLNEHWLCGGPDELLSIGPSSRPLVGAHVARVCEVCELRSRTAGTTPTRLDDLAPSDETRSVTEKPDQRAPPKPGEIWKKTRTGHVARIESCSATMVRFCYVPGSQSRYEHLKDFLEAWQPQARR